MFKIGLFFGRKKNCISAGTPGEIFLFTRPDRYLDILFFYSSPGEYFRYSIIAFFQPGTFQRVQTFKMTEFGQNA